MDRISGNRRLLCSGIIALFTTANLFAQYTVNLPFKNVTVENKDGAALFFGSSLGGNPGEPALPQYTVEFLLPAEVDPRQATVDIVDPVFKDVDGQFTVKPVGPLVGDKKEIWPEGKRIVDGKDVDVYSKDAYFPSDFKGFVSKGKMRQYGIVQVAIHPFLYNPVSKKLREIIGGKVVLTIGSDKQTMQSNASVGTQTAQPNQEIERMLARSVVNSEAVSTYQPRQAMEAAAPLTNPYYVIIASDADNLRADAVTGPALSTFAQRKLLSYSNVLYVTETISYNYANGQSTADGWSYAYGADNPDKIRYWLQNRYLTWNITQVLIIGDPNPIATTGVPMKYNGLDAPTDFYFAELTENWNPDNNDRIGNWDDYVLSNGALKYADVAVGRIPYYGNKQDLAKIIQKINKYETSTCRTWRKNMLLPMEPTSQFIPGWQMGERIRTDIAQPAGFASYRLYDQINSYTGNTNDLPVGNPGPGPAGLATNPENLVCDETNVFAQWTTNHYGMVVWWSHGSSQNAVDIFSSVNAPYLNDDFPAMTFQASCTNAFPDDHDNLAYAFLRNGAINTVGATNVSYGEMYWVDQTGVASAIGIGYAYANYVVTYNTGAGTALNSAKRDLPVNNNEYWKNCILFNVYGTPDLTLSYTTPEIPPEAPSAVTATAASTSQITLTWHDNSCNEVGFRIESATSSSGPWTSIAWIAADFQYYYNTGLSPNTTYFYRVCAYNNYGNSAYSNTASATTLPATPAAPSGLTATAASSSQINLSWADNSNNETGFYIERSSSSSGPWSQIATLGANATTYANSGLTANTTYWYRVRAYNASGTSAYSNSASATTSGATPTAPSGLAATKNSCSQITITWTDNSTNETGFYIERATSSSGPWSQIASVGANVTSYVNTGLTANTTYWYRVRAYNGSGNSAYSSTASANTGSCGSVPAAPSGLTATAASSSRINLSWTDNSTNETGFYIERSSSSSGPWTQIASVGASVKTYSNTGLTANTTYWYRVRAYNASGTSAYSNSASATTSGGVPNAPSSLTATANSRTQVTLSWTDNSTNETGFYIERAGSDSVFSQIASVGANVHSYVNTGLSGYTTYLYRVRAYSASGNSAYSNIGSVKTHGNLSVLYGTASASSAQTANPVGNAKDNKTDTRWAASSATMPQWYKIDLGSARTISEFEVMFERAGTSGDCNDFKIETSSDNATWTSRVDRSTNTNTAQTQNFMVSTSVRYARITILDAPGNYYASMFEFKVIGQ